MSIPVRERFDSNWTPEPNTGCWLWTGSANKAGYGHTKHNGTTWVAHRLGWTLYRGPIPEGMFIDHMCRQKGCVNPDHLRLVTPRINAIENNDGITALNARKTHCKRGHALDEANTGTTHTGTRQCRTCCREKSLRDNREKLRIRLESLPPELRDRARVRSAAATVAALAKGKQRRDARGST